MVRPANFGEGGLVDHEADFGGESEERASRLGVCSRFHWRGLARGHWENEKDGRIYRCRFPAY